jgi:hypothetical protein
MVVALAAVSVAFLHSGNLVVVNTATHAQRIVMQHAGIGPVRWSGDGRLVSSGGKIAGGPTLPTAQLTWAPTGETAAYIAKRGAVYVWDRQSGSRLVAARSWGAQSVAWSHDGRLAIGRMVCQTPCGVPEHREVWVWTPRSFRVIVKLKNTAGVPMPQTWDSRGRVLWWLWPDSGSIAADGVALYANDRKIASMLMYPDYIAQCGTRLALAVGGDRNSMHGKSIVVGGRDVSRDRTRSWVSPSCSTDGSFVVASAGLENTQGPWGREHRAVWQLLPKRRQLTQPPAGWTDESPHVLRDGSVLFVRTRQTSRKRNGQWYETDRGLLELLRGRTITTVAPLTYTAGELSGAFLQDYGHYGWASRLAVSG